MGTIKRRRSRQLLLSLLSIAVGTIAFWSALGLADVLKVNSSLQRLNITYNGIGAKGIRYLADALKVNMSLLELVITHNSIGAEGAVKLGESIAKLSQLHTLTLNLW